jgi:crotonobetainyl-CoA:carnitine CoA-transferase CaiB-like acyl-CoA transferase
MLNDVRVLEVSAPETMLAGSILADLGADVVIVEPPAGSPARRLEPFLDEIPGLERSLTWHALNRNKRAITLDLDCSDGRGLFTTLAERFDIVLESAAPGGRAPLDEVSLSANVIRCTISAFARSGPKSDYAASDLLVMASTGTPAMTGDPDRPPLIHAVPQSMMEAGAEAAIAALACLLARDRDGEGQQAEISARIAAMMSALSVPLAVGAGNPEPTRSGAAGLSADARIPSIFECADGYMIVTVPAFGPSFGPMTQRLAKWAADEGHLAREIAEVNWITFPADVRTKTASPVQLQALVRGVTSLCRNKTKAELSAAARKLGLLAAPMMDMKDVAESEQYRERGLWTPVKIGPGGREVNAPARFAQFSNFTIETKRGAPTLSEHTAEILQADAAISPTELQALFVHGII